MLSNINKYLSYVLICIASNFNLVVITCLELQLGRVLGRGGFCCVNEINSIKLDNKYDKKKPTKNGADFMTRGFMAKHCIRDGDARYAMKKLGEHCLSDRSIFLKGTMDLALEGKFLAMMSHPHIVKLRSLSIGGSFDGNSFLVLDRLYETLEQRILKWKKGKGNVLESLFGGKKKNKGMQERLRVAWDLSTAFKYIHSFNIIYRDIKPENIGFDVRVSPYIRSMHICHNYTFKDLS